MVSVNSSVAWWARTEPQRLALVYGNQRLSYAQLDSRVEVASAVLITHGVKAGDVIALLMKNSAAFLELALAVSRVGAVLLPINYRLERTDINFIADHAGVSLLLVDEELCASVPPGLKTVIISKEAQADSRILCTSSSVNIPEPYPKNTADLYRLMYTSGTTAHPKGVMHTYNNVTWKTLDHINALSLGKEDKLLVVGPLYHVGAFDLPGLALWFVGGALVVERDFDELNALDLIEKERITGAWMAPVMLNRCLCAAKKKDRDLSSLKWLIGGGERTPEGRIHEFSKIFSYARYIDAYGLTETCSGDTLMQSGREIEKIGSTGRALAHVEIAIFDDEGQSLAAGEQGEVCLRGPKITQGYWRDEDATIASFFGDWFRSGDIGYLDEEGFLFLTDRKKDMIISGGENIASSEVERVIYELPYIAEVAVVGLPDSQWGESVTAVVVLKPNQTLSLEQLREHCLGRLSRFKVPKRLVVSDVLPRNPSGKVLKRELRAQLVEQS